MNLIEADNFLRSEMKAFASTMNAELLFENAKSNHGATGGIILACAYLHVNPALIALRAKRNQYILQVNYIAKEDIIMTRHDKNISLIINKFNLDLKIDGGGIIYQPTARTHWMDGDRGLEAVISIYLQFDEVI